MAGEWQVCPRLSSCLWHSAESSGAGQPTPACQRGEPAEQDGASPGAVPLCWRACQQGVPAAVVSAEGCPLVQRELRASCGLGGSLPRGVELHSHAFPF